MASSADAISFCKIDAHLDTNPKIRKAGRDGRDVFEFIVRRNSLMERDGSIPIRYIEPWYLADVLMMSEAEASHGVSRAVTACLIEVDTVQGVVRIVGWTPDWGRTRRSDAERKADQRAREKAAAESKSPESDTPVTPNRDSCDTSRDVTAVTDQRREDKSRSEEDHISAPAAPGSIKTLKARVDKARKQRAPHTRFSDDWAPTETHAAKAREGGVDLEFQREKFKNDALAKDKTFANWDRAFSNWLLNAIDWKRPAQQSLGVKVGRVEPLKHGEYPDGEIQL